MTLAYSLGFAGNLIGREIGARRNLNLVTGLKGHDGLLPGRPAA
jgi:hypothetical protein